MSATLRFWVPGHPKTKGSLSARARRCHCCEACKGTLGATQLRDTPASSDWRKLMAYQASAAIGALGIDGPVVLMPVGAVAVACAFVLTDADITAQGAGDIDKLVRNLLDAMQDAAVYANDSQVTVLTTTKQRVQDWPIVDSGPAKAIAGWTGGPGVLVTVTSLV